MKKIIIPVITIVLSTILGILSDSTIVGILVLTTGILNSYYGIIKNKINFIIGVINNVLMTYISIKNNLFGLAIFNLCLFMPLNIKGYIEWNKVQETDEVETRSLGIKKGIIVLIISIVISLTLAYLLNLIPGERLSILDGFTNIISFIAGILLMLRYKESWYIYIVNNILDLVIWIITFVDKGENSFMVLLMSIMYLLLNIYGIINWKDDTDEKI